MNINVKGEPLFNGNCYTTPEIDYIIHTQHRNFDQASCSELQFRFNAKVRADPE